MEIQRLNFPHIPPARFTDRISGTEKGDEVMRRDNYELCQGIDITHLDVTLEKMVKENGLSPRMAENFHIQAASLLAATLTENHRLHNY